MIDDSRSGPVEAAVEAARRRRMTLNGVRDASMAAAAALAGVALLLALGLDAFPPLLVWLTALAGLAGAAWHWLRTRPDPYAVAQALDRRWDANDQISTAWHFGRLETAPETAGLQRALADSAALSGDVAEAFPFAWPRAARWTAVLLAVCLALLALRLAVQPKLDLQPPLAPLLFPALARDDARAEALDPERALQRDETSDEAFALDRPGETHSADRPAPLPKKDALEIPVGQQEEGQAADAFQMPEVEGLSAGDEFGDEMAMDSKGKAGETGADSQAGGDQAPGAEPGDESASAGDEKSGDWSEKSNNLLDRLKEAFQNMMESMGMEPPETAQGDPQQGQQQGGEQRPEAGQQGQAQADAGAQPTDAEMEGGEPGQGEPQQTAQGQGSSDTNQAGQQGEAASASGSADGSKELAEEYAEQQAALDALEEFFQKRAEELQAEILIETSTSEQTAATPYRDVAGRHSDRGGAVNRDEIPLAYRPFIEQYFRNLRAKDQN